MDSKTILRKKAREIRKSLDIELLSNNLIKQIRQQDYYNGAKNVLLFYPLRYEYNLLDLLNDGKNFFLPKVNGNDLYICPFKLGDKLQLSTLKIKEPCSNPVDPNCLDLIIVPALLVDKYNYRLGYGGGFYDRFLAKYPKVTTVVPIARQMVIDSIPKEDFDVKIDYVLTM